jgi:uncharacterized protein (UPF0297 family)
VRNFSRVGSRVVGVALVAVVALAASLGLAAPQFTSTTPTSNLPLDQLDHSHLSDDPSYVPRELQARQLKRLREQHQKEVLNDTARLVELATTLKQEMFKGDQDTADALKNVDEIGKLAKRVSDRIKTQ